MDKKLNVKDSLDKLNDILNAMKTNSLDIDANIKLYEEGMKIISEIENSLKESSEEIDKIIE
ncbi:MAG: exodeoxyribonuclease VII small subunit [Bacilli bacterium]